MIRGETTAFTRAVAAEIRAIAGRENLAQRGIAKTLGRSQGYVSTRMNGLDPFNTDDLDNIAELVNMTGAELMLEVIRGARLGEQKP
jgi:transcriptional regulator with XRE-family HTH domain